MAEVFYNSHEAPHLYGSAKAVGMRDFYDNEAKETDCNDTRGQDWFSFPAKCSETTLPPIEEPPAPIVKSDALHKAETVSRFHTRAINSTSSLPPFRFNPSALTETSLQDPEPIRQSPVSAPSTPVRAGRHRRTASELIGGSARPGPASHRSGSPDKYWIGNSSQPTIIPFGSLPTRFETGHRRTNTLVSEQSLPTGQSIFLNSLGHVNDPLVTLPPSLVEERLIRPDTTSLKSPFPFTTTRLQHKTTADESSPVPRSPSRARVGFSDTLEFIPRPLSTISSESGSSMSTIRGHSMSGSISSVLCQAAGSPLSKPTGNPPLNATDNGQSPLRARSTSPGIGLGHTRSTLTFEDNSLAQRPTSAGPCLDGSRSVSTCTASQGQTQPIASLPNINSGEPSIPRKVGHWAALLGRRIKPTESAPKESKGAAVSSSQPTTEEVSSSSDLDRVGAVELSEDFDTDPTSIIISLPQRLDFSATQTPPFTPIASKRMGDNAHGAAVSAMIDLDLAFGPGPLLDPNYEFGGGKVRKVAESRRSMRNSTVSSGFFAAGVHRRADSAPSHVPVNFDAANFRERNSSTPSFKRSQMEDVFEEDEDDFSGPDLPYGSSAPSMASKEGLGIGIETINNSNPEEALDFQHDTVEASNVLKSTPRGSWSNPLTGFSARQDDKGLVPAIEAVQIVDNEASRTGADQPSPNSSAFVEIPAGAKNPNQAGTEALSLPNRPYFNFEPRTGSPLSSPHCCCENECVHSGRRNTSTSFGTDIRKFHTHAFGEPGTELRYSVDDVPSLISSRSTMTNHAHARAPSTSSRGFAPRSTSSSLSLSSAMERRKRSSIVSLSRFVGGPFSEKSRQVLEPGKRWQSPLSAKEDKPVKSSRLSRLFKFWKPKDSTP